jgi:hypothetical protein
MASLIGSSPGQISTNGMLGEMAFQNTSGITVRSIQSPVGFGTTVTSSSFPTSGTLNEYTNLTLQPNAGNVVIGSGSSLATTATNGFLCIPTCSGPPTVGPSTNSSNRAIPIGTVPLIYDTLNNRLYIRTPAGSWRYSITTG